jgi:pyruvate,orthophosphate dikinase
MQEKWVYLFSEGNAKMKGLLGGKGANLAEMSRLGLPIPPGFTLTTKACLQYYKKGRKLPNGCKEQINQALTEVEKTTGKKFGDKKNPLLVSVRSGAPVSMPGMMDTVLNLGLNDEVIEGLIEQIGDRRFALDVYRRFIQMFSDIVLKIPRENFEEVLDSIKRGERVKFDKDISTNGLARIVEEYKAIIEKEVKRPFPSDPKEQLLLAIRAVFESWNNKRAITYRKINKIPDTLGTAINVQTMVFGNIGEDSATGVAFTRNPADGENRLYGEYLTNAQGEDVVAGIRTPKPIADLGKENLRVYEQLANICKLLERHYKDMQDIEFTIEKSKLWILQTRTGKRTALATVKAAVDMVEEGLITKEEAVKRIEPSQIDMLLHPMIDPKAKIDPLAKGLPASPGAATGKAVFTPEDAVELKEKKEPSILVRLETSPEDIAGMHACEGILTQRGGMTSHAAVVSRAMGKPCIVGCESIGVDYKKEEFRVKDLVLKKGDVITLDGTTGNVMKGEVPKVTTSLKGEFGKLLQYADGIRKLGVKANADTPEQAKVAHEFGAEGVGLCRTEHMFFGENRIKAVREMIIADNVKQRKRALSKLLPMQKDDFKKFFREMSGLPIIIRTLDPPLHEFLPKEAEQIRELAKEMDIEEEKLRMKVASLSEINPMLGHRGCRLGISYPEITEMQARAIFEAACEVKKEGIEVIPEVMIPVVNEAHEFENQRKIVERVAKEVMNEYGMQMKYKVGIMIELPRACITADQIAKKAEFFSFGTNDLTQTTFGFSRDDVGKILPDYIEKRILGFDPFQRIDERGVGELVRIGIEKGRSTNPNLEIGICGEHGGEPYSIEFCHRVGMNYVSCSPYRVPIARIAAARAALKEREGNTLI